MISGVSINETYEGPSIGALEFRLGEDNIGRRRDIINKLSSQVGVVSAHLPSFLPVQDIGREVAFDVEGKIHHFVAHVTKRADPGGDWRSAWKKYSECGKKLLFENHNQDWHQTDAGICWPDEFKPLVDAGHEMCLDVGHILYASMFKTQDPKEWIDIAEKAFEGFLSMPIRAVHVHTVNHFGGVDHSLEGFDVGPWLRKIVEKHPDVVLLVEIMDQTKTPEQKLSILGNWLRPENVPI